MPTSRPAAIPRLFVLVFAVLLAAPLSVGSARPTLAAVKDTALRFDGSNDFVTFGAATSTLGTPSFTLETWFKRTAPGVGVTTGGGGIASAIPLVTKGRGEGETPANVNMNYFLGLDATSGTLVADFEDTINGGNHPVTGVTQVSSNVWHHAAVTYDATAGVWNLYLDGTLDKTLTLTSAFQPEFSSIQHAGIATAMTSAGTGTGGPAGFFAGDMDEVRIWNVARSQAEIQAAMTSELTSGTGLIGRWGLNEGTSTTAVNSIAGSPNGTLVNGPTWVL
ncbi:MAG TPA: LamG domain-containing protein, partial [Propionicimonas sp.]|uniref:LamG domain-containing protein n=1 Tax=Propionicimonas sp. TaxID=1955623 RepID=UPI002F4218A8